jgi:RNA polymerase sigma factor (sigma-70 family)
MTPTARGAAARASLRTVAERNALALANRGLVGLTLKRFFPFLHAAEEEDAWQAGFLGLLRAAELFDPGRGRALGTMAVPWVRQAVGQWLVGQDLVRVGDHVQGEARRVARRRVLARRLSPRDARLLPAREEANAVDDADEADHRRRLAARVLAELPTREALVLRLLFLEGRSLRAAAAELGVCKKTARQAAGRALQQARGLLSR